MNFLIGITAEISEISMPLWKSANKAILIWSENPPSKKSSNANANSQTKIKWLVSVRFEIPLKWNSEKNRATKFYDIDVSVIKLMYYATFSFWKTQNMFELH